MKILKQYIGLSVLLISCITYATSQSEEKKTKQYHLYEYFFKDYEREDCDYSIIDRNYNSEVNDEVTVLNSIPSFREQMSREWIEDLKSLVKKELGLSEQEALSLINKDDPNIAYLKQKVIDDNVLKLRNIAEKNVNNNEFHNLSTCMQVCNLLRTRPIDDLKLGWKEEVIKQLNVLPKEADILIKNEDHRAMKIFDQVIELKSKVAYLAYKKAQATILNKIASDKKSIDGEK